MDGKNIDLDTQLLTDTGVLIFNPSDDIPKDFEGAIIFAMTSEELTGTLDGDCQLQGSLDGTNWVDLGSTVAIVDAATVGVPLAGTVLYYTNYRVTVTGVGTQTTNVTGRYGKKSRG